MSRYSSLATHRMGRRGLLKAGGAMAAAGALTPMTFAIREAGAQDVTTITMWGNHPEWADAMGEIIAAFESVEPTVQIDFSAVTSDQYGAKIQTAIQGGETSDIFGDQEGSVIVRVRAGGELPFIDVTDRVDVSGLTDTARGQVEVDGVVYGCPLAAYTVGLAINNQVFADAGVVPPTTWDELTATCEALKSAGVAAPIVLGGKDWVHPYFMYIGLASSVLRPEGVEAVRQGTKSLSDPDVVSAVQLLVDLMPYYNAGFEATDYTTAKAIFANGQGAMMVAGTTDYTGYYQVNPDADLSFVAWPGPGPDMTATTTGFELLYTVSAFSDTEKQDAAAKFVNWLATVEAQQMVMDKISLAVHKDITESVDPIRTETIAASRGVDVPVWYAVPELNGSVIATQDNHGGLWTGRISPQEFSDIQQAAVVPSGAATPTA
ncbi:MAG: extracellular solute-binding protein [Thermomicrobiales bacterium]|nr:extracellular solute-binding protein [Thermomicrobiales bacterium]MCO5223533.1 extracellular solute-binding protein [Thermomicrobiales bacterium]